MTQQNETPETPEAPEARVLVAHLNMDVDTDQGVKVNINASREALIHMLSAVFAKMMDDEELSVLEMYAMMHCITEHASDSTVRKLTLIEQYVLEQSVLEQVRSRGLGLLDAVRATPPLIKEMTCNYVA